MAMNYHIAGFEEESIVDGPGLRFVIFFQGCPHHCHGCQNPETWDTDKNKGQYFSLEELVSKIEKNPLISGVTFSGGEPFLQSIELIPLAKILKEKKYNIWCFTGYKYEEIYFNPLLNYIDVLIDGPFIEKYKSLDLLFRGSKNQRLIDIQQTKKLGNIVLWENNF